MRLCAVCKDKATHLLNMATTQDGFNRVKQVPVCADHRWTGLATYCGENYSSIPGTTATSICQQTPKEK